MVPSEWSNHPTREYLLDLHAPDDARTAVQLRFFDLDRLLFAERVNELIQAESSQYSLQRKEAIIHDNTGAYEADFHFKAADVNLMIRQVYLPVKGGLAALRLVTRLATWSRYNSVFLGVQRTFTRFPAKTSLSVVASPPSASSVTSRPTVSHSDEKLFLL